MRDTNFKHTEIGVLPKDWEIKPIGDLYTIRSSKRVFQSQWTTKGIPFFRAREIVSLNNKEIFSSPLFISRELYAQLKDSYGVPQINDILITGVGTLGIPYLIDNNIPFYFKDGNIIWLQHQDLCDSVFVKYCYKSPIILEQIYGDGIGSTVGTYTIQRARQTLVPYPTLEEQYKIGRTLTDIDDLIFSLKKLIEKKRAIKAGAMSQLLSGKLRLPGFSEPWISTSLDELGDFFKGRGISREEANSGEIPAIRYGEIYTDHNNYIRHFKSYISREVAERSFLLQNGDLCFTASGETLDEIGKTVAFASDEIAYAGGDIIILRPTKEINPIFFGFLLNTPPVVKQKSLKGHGVSIMHIRAKALAEIQVSYPSDLEEQKEIAKVLTDMDEEISALEAKLKKYEQLKKGMMQQLLTGKIRLVSPNESLS